MRHILTVAAALATVFTAFAQPQGQGRMRPDGPGFGPQLAQMDPVQMAQEQTDRLDRLVSLTPKQYKKIFKFNKRQGRQLQREMENAMPQGRPEGFPEGMGPGRGPGMRPDGMGPGGRPPRGDGQFRPGPRGEEMRQLMQEQQEKRAKKYRKVLSPEQYEKWASFEAERQFRQMIETPR